MKRILIANIVIKEWYDGFVSGVVECDIGICICVLGSYDLDTGNRIYALIRLAPKTSSKLAAECIDRLIAAQACLGAASFVLFDSVYVTKGPIIANVQVDAVPALPMQVKAIKSLKWPVIDAAIEPSSKDTWSSDLTAS